MLFELFETLSTIPQIEFDSIGINDLTIEKQLRFLETFKNIKDIEKKKSCSKGFSNGSILNQARDSHIYTKAEQLFKNLCESFNLNPVHELKIKVKDSENRLHLFKLDFYFQDSKIDVEISPAFHKTYRIVAIRDKLKAKLLKKDGIKVYHVDVIFKHDETFIDINKAKKLCLMIQKATTKKSCLNYWI